jgi:hypothetical protein
MPTPYLNRLEKESRGANFGRLVQIELCSGFKWAPTSGQWDWTSRISRFLVRIPCFQKQKKTFIDN